MNNSIQTETYLVLKTDIVAASFAANNHLKINEKKQTTKKWK